MNTQYQLARACACLLLAAAGTHAHARQAQAAAADPQAAVPATRYQPALGQRPEAPPATSPDRNWVAANETVAATNSMSLTMKMGGQADPHAGHAMHDMHDMHGMGADRKDGPAMCTPGGSGADGKGMQCQSGCGASCCCKDKMSKEKEAS